MTVPSLFARAVFPSLALATFAMAAGTLRAQALPQYDHIVVVIYENKNDTEIRGNTAMAPYINNTLIPNSANFTAFVAETHPSQPNYLQFFSGAQQGVVYDNMPGTAEEPGTLAAPPPFHTPNLGREVINAGKTFATFSETLPSVGFLGETYTPNPALNEYVHKHNPSANWQDDTATTASNPWALPSSTNQPFNAFGATPADFAKLPSFCIVVPNEQDDMHDGTILQGDTWLQNNIEPYRQWAVTHNSLLIFTFDESDLGALQADPTNQIITVVSGAHVINGNYPETAIAQFRLSDAAAPETAINHYNLADTIETIFGTTHDVTAVATSGNPNVTIKPIIDIFASDPVSRKVHGSAGTFDLPLPSTGTTATECRVPGANNSYELVYTLPGTVATPGRVTMTQGTAVASSAVGPQSNQVTVNLTGVANAQRLIVTLTGAQSNAGSTLADISAHMNVLIGDVNGSGRTDSGDVTLVQQHSVQAVSQSNFLFDVNLSGRIDSGDVTVTHSHTVTALP